MAKKKAKKVGPPCAHYRMVALEGRLACDDCGQPIPGSVTVEDPSTPTLIDRTPRPASDADLNYN